MHVCAKLNCRNRISIGSENDKDNVSFVCLNCNRVYYNSPSAISKIIKLSKIILLLIIISSIIFLSVRYKQEELLQQTALSGDNLVLNENTIPISWIDLKLNILDKLKKTSISPFQKNDLATLEIFLHAIQGSKLSPVDTLYFTNKLDSIINHQSYTK